MMLPGREDVDTPSPGKIRRVINFFKSPFKRNKETGALETPKMVDVEAQPKQESLLGEDPNDLFGLGSADDDLMASLRKRVNEGPSVTEEEEGEVSAKANSAPAKLYDRRRKARPNGVADTSSRGGVAGTVLERPSGASSKASGAAGSAGTQGPRKHKPTGKLAGKKSPYKEVSSKPRPSGASGSPSAKKAADDGVDMDSVGAAGSRADAGAGSGDEGPAMASAADIERLNKLFGMGSSEEKA